MIENIIQRVEKDGERVREIHSLEKRREQAKMANFRLITPKLDKRLRKWHHKIHF